jgi:hypothetical protein
MKTNKIKNTTQYVLDTTIHKMKTSLIEKNRGKNETLNTHIHDRPLFWVGTGTSIKSSGVKLDFSLKSQASVFHMKQILLKK